MVRMQLPLTAVRDSQLLVGPQTQTTPMALMATLTLQLQQTTQVVAPLVR